MISADILEWIQIDYDALPPTQLSLLDAAAEAFTKMGFAAASIDIIASQIGATKGSVYYHYRSKADLLFAVHKRAMVINFKAQVPVVSRESLDPRAKLERMVHNHSMLMMDFIYYQRVTVQGVEVLKSSSTTPSEREALVQVVAMRDAYEDLFRSVLAEGARIGQFTESDYRLAARSILGALNWITMWYRPRDVDSAEYKRHVADQITRQALFGVTPRAPTPAASGT